MADNLSPEFIQYLADARLSVEGYVALSPVERSSIVTNFRLSLPRAPGN
jgi:hypothetical protein